MQGFDFSFFHTKYSLCWDSNEHNSVGFKERAKYSTKRSHELCSVQEQLMDHRHVALPYTKMLSVNDSSVTGTWRITLEQTLLLSAWLLVNLHLMPKLGQHNSANLAETLCSEQSPCLSHILSSSRFHIWATPQSDLSLPNAHVLKNLPYNDEWWLANKGWQTSWQIIKI